jgi:hypothetical protein
MINNQVLEDIVILILNLTLSGIAIVAMTIVIPLIITYEIYKLIRFKTESAYYFLKDNTKGE